MKIRLAAFGDSLLRLRTWEVSIAAALLVAMLPAGKAAAADEPDTKALGEAAFQKNCAVCHDGGGGNPFGARPPARSMLKQMPAERIRKAVVNGRMRVNAMGLSPEEIEALIKFLAAEPAQ